MSHIAVPTVCKALLELPYVTYRCTRQTRDHKHHECTWWDGARLITVRWREQR